MTEAHAIARQAAQHLAAKYGADLPMEVEKIIHGGEKPGQYVSIGDVAGVAGVIVAVATLAWTIWHDTRSTSKTLDAETLRREVRLKLPDPKGVDATTREEIIVTITDEVVKR